VIWLGTLLPFAAGLGAGLYAWRWSSRREWGDWLYRPPQNR
jgi:hypothetical protein